MKTISLKKPTNSLFILLMLTTSLAFTSCSDSGKENTRKSLNEFKDYVAVHKNAQEKNLDKKWEDLEKDYNEKKAKLDNDFDKMDQDMKNGYKEAIANWDDFKADYQRELKEKEDMAKAELLKVTLLPKDINTDFTNIIGKNIADVFVHFVNTVDAHKEMYSKEEWININNYWESLKNLANRLDDEHKISKENNRKIAGQKIKYGAIKVLNKPFSESENKESK